MRDPVALAQLEEIRRQRLSAQHNLHTLYRNLSFFLGPRPTRWESDPQHIRAQLRIQLNALQALDAEG